MPTGCINDLNERNKTGITTVIYESVFLSNLFDANTPTSREFQHGTVFFFMWQRSQICVAHTSVAGFQASPFLSVWYIESNKTKKAREVYCCFSMIDYIFKIIWKCSPDHVHTGQQFIATH